MAKIGRNDPCLCGSGRKHKKCCLDRDRATDSADELLSAYESTTPGEIVLRLQTDRGTLVRRIASASPLRPDTETGSAAEDATHIAAATWGLPDFVFRPVIRREQSSSREVGDGILLLGDVGVVVQVKSRQHDSVSDAEKERRWAEKHIKQALSQANGTIRLLQRSKTLMSNIRGREMEDDGNQYRWLEVVVVDHPNLPRQFVPDATPAKHPAVVLSRRDWEFLFSQLKSTHAVVGYLERVADELVDLDSESLRFTELAVADMNAPPAPPDFEFLGDGAWQMSAPQLPLQPVAATEAHLLVRMIFEGIAVGRREDSFDEITRLRVLAELDRLPVAYRGEIGQVLLAWLDEVTDPPPGTTDWRLRRVVPSRRVGGDRTQLAFGTCSEFNDFVRDCFGAWVQLRHHELHAEMPAVDRDQLTTIGVLLTNRSDGVRPWDTTMIGTTGDLELTDDDLTAFRAVWSRDEPEAA